VEGRLAAGVDRQEGVTALVELLEGWQVADLGRPEYAVRRLLQQLGAERVDLRAQAEESVAGATSKSSLGLSIIFLSLASLWVDGAARLGGLAEGGGRGDNEARERGNVLARTGRQGLLIGEPNSQSFNHLQSSLIVSAVHCEISRSMYMCLRLSYAHPFTIRNLKWHLINYLFPFRYRFGF
jgi:hypothetical protein